MIGATNPTRIVEVINTLNPNVVPKFHRQILKEASVRLIEGNVDASFIEKISDFIENETVSWYVRRLAGQILYWLRFSYARELLRSGKVKL